jgi:hypothetical protein
VKADCSKLQLSRINPKKTIRKIRLLANKPKIGIKII